MPRFILTPALLLFMTASASAQSPAAPQAGLGGNPVPGVCRLSREAIIANAAIGKAATARLNPIAAPAPAEHDAERQPPRSEETRAGNEGVSSGRSRGTAE